MRHIKRIHPARFSPIADLITYSPLPSASLPQLDPFLFLNHHGYQEYPSPNNGLPFGPHPHRGMETVTFILKGDIAHRDSGGHESIIEAGGVQYMRAGRGLIHAEVSSKAFMKNGGPLEILQLWLNLPAKLKMAEPHYEGFSESQIPTASEANGNIHVQVVSGEWNGTKGAFQTPTDCHLATLFFKPGVKLSLNIPADRTIFFYLISGSFQVNGAEVPMRHLVEFTYEGSRIDVLAQEEGILLLGHALPLKEPVVAQGPFVMNTEQEIRQAYLDYQAGKFGSWE